MYKIFNFQAELMLHTTKRCYFIYLFLNTYSWTSDNAEYSNICEPGKKTVFIHRASSLFVCLFYLS